MTGPLVNAILGVGFFVTGTLATFLMFHLWGYPYDKETHKSEAPESLVFVHRLCGYAYLAIYVYLMLQMTPRMWTYQIELPARTVVHLSCGMLIGAILIVKLMIVRFFKHLEGPLVPLLGTGLWLATCLVVFISVPYTFRESYLLGQALPDTAIRQENLVRVKKALESAGQADEELLDKLSSMSGLTNGRAVLFSNCTECHDLRTVLAKPRTPSNWRSTVSRMAARSELVAPISELEEWQVTAYLIAISPNIQISVSKKEKTVARSEATRNALQSVASTNETSAPENYTEVVARTIYESKCSECHGLEEVENYGFQDRNDVVKVLERMARKDGFEANRTELDYLLYFLEKEFVDASGQ